MSLWAERGSSTTKILVVDNHPEVLAVARDALKRAAYDVVTAENAEKALTIVVEQPIDVVLAEVLMPGVRGTELLRNAQRCRPSIAPMLMSGYTGGEVVDASIVFLPKPFTAGMLVDCVASALRRKSAGEGEKVLKQKIDNNRKRFGRASRC